MREVIILGAGISGIAAADHALKHNLSVKLFDKNPYLGGHTYSHNNNGFIFDEGPHISFTKNTKVKEIFAQSVKNQFLEQRARISNIWKTSWVKHPAQCNLNELPHDIKLNCVIDFVESYYRQKNLEYSDYAEWCIGSFGKSFSENFLFKYSDKYWTTHPQNMTIDWMENRIYKPDLTDILKGALDKVEESKNYITDFRYPKNGGFLSFLKSFNVAESFYGGHEVCEISPDKKKVEFKNGSSFFYENVISSLPLPILIKLIKDCPKYVKEAADKLTCTSVVVVNIALKSKEGLPNHHWFYDYNVDSVFARVNMPHNLSEGNCPGGAGSLQAEIYYSKYKALKTMDFEEEVIKDLKKIRIVNNDHQILFANHFNIPYANVLFDHHRKDNLRIVNKYLDGLGILRCGRYGEWKYFWTDTSLLSGLESVDKILSKDS